MVRGPALREDGLVGVDVCVETTIDRPVGVVAAFAGDPFNAPDWYADIKPVDWQTAPPVAIGSRVDFVAQFLGRRLAYTYEVVELELDHLLVMRTVDGPFPMQTIYTWREVGERSTRMTQRNQGKSSGFARATAPMMELAVRRATTKDLMRLKVLLESGKGGL